MRGAIMKKKVLSTLVFLLLTLSLMACGDKKDTANEPKAEEKKEQDTVTTEPESVDKPEASEEENAESKDYSGYTLDINSDELLKDIETLDKRYDTLTEEVQGFLDKPETYTLETNLTFYEEYGKLTNDGTGLFQFMLSFNGNTTDWEHHDKWMALKKKSDDLMLLTGKLPTELD